MCNTPTSDSTAYRRRDQQRDFGQHKGGRRQHRDLAQHDLSVQGSHCNAAHHHHAAMLAAVFLSAACSLYYSLILYIPTVNNHA